MNRFSNLVEMLLGISQKFGDKTALMHKVSGAYQSITYKEFAERVKNFAFGLASLGVEKGDKVSILSENRPEWPISDFAILSLGAINVPIYPTLPPKQIEYILNNAGVKVIVVSDGLQRDKIIEIFEQVKTLKKIIIMSEKEEKKKDCLWFKEVLELGKDFGQKNSGYYENTIKQIKPDDIMTFIYTSGTTGVPKGVMLKHSNFLSNAYGAKEVIKPLDETDVFLSFLPLSHVFERMLDYTAYLSGCTVAFAERIETVPDNMQEVKPTIIATVPRLPEKMYARVMEKVNNDPALRRKIFFWGIEQGKKYSMAKRANPNATPGFAYNLASKLVFSKLKARLGGKLRFFVSGGAPLPKEIGEFFDYAGIAIIEGYGLTETSPVICVNRLEKYKFGTVGPAIPGVEVKIAEDGEILTRGPHVMVGYYNNPEATKEAIDSEGWFHTGDIGEFDEDGYLKITDRKKNLIVTSGGKNVAPQPIENTLKLCRYVADILVIGDKRKFVSAVIIPNFDALNGYVQANGINFSTKEELVNHPQIQELYEKEINKLQDDAQLAHYERVKKFLLMAQEFTVDNGFLTPTLKIKRKVVEEKFKNEIDKMYAEA